MEIETLEPVMMVCQEYLYGIASVENWPSCQ
jgi:hypothetical protein